MRVIVRAIKDLVAAGFRLASKPCNTGERLTRYAMYQRLAGCVPPLGLPTAKGSVLSISGSALLGQVLGISPAIMVDASYPDYNVLNLSFPDERFDLVLFDQVLEHVEGNPQDAIDEIYRVLKPGGLLICGTVLVYPIHAYPSDFWRFTPEGLKLLCSDFSEIVEYGGWGNMYVWFLAWLGLHQEPVPLCRWHPIHKVASFNDPNWKIVTWVVARK